MSARHSVLMSGEAFGLGALGADNLAKLGPDAVLRRKESKSPAQQRFRKMRRGHTVVEDDIRREERCRERARIVQELHDTLLQGFLGACLLLHQAVEDTPVDSPSKPALNRALNLVRRAIDEGRAALTGIRMASPAPSSLEQSFSNLLGDVTTTRSLRLRIFVQGKPRPLSPIIQEQLFFIGREAVMNALRHSKATKIEVEIQYQPCVLCLVVRDNGCGIDPEAVQRQSDSHWGLCGMRERAEQIGARFSIWSRLGAGTEVRVAVPLDGATVPA